MKRSNTGVSFKQKFSFTSALRTSMLLTAMANVPPYRRV
jgi:hypothetical protein